MAAAAWVLLLLLFPIAALCQPVSEADCVSMRTDTYRKKLGDLVEQDQDVFHIIAKANGGADHPDNYDFARGRAWNIAIGTKFDHINCYQAGKMKCEKAVAISKLWGSHACSKKDHPGHKKYDGPSAEELYKNGEALLRDLRAKARTDGRLEIELKAEL